MGEEGSSKNERSGMDLRELQNSKARARRVRAVSRGAPSHSEAEGRKGGGSLSQ